MSDDVIIGNSLTIPAAEIEITAIRSQGAGGQNVNKVASAVHLRFDINKSQSLPEEVRTRLLDSHDKRITSDGVLVIKSQQHRTQERNRRAAIDRLRDVVAAATVKPKSRKKTRPTRAAREQRLADKHRRSRIKESRGRVSDDD